MIKRIVLYVFFGLLFNPFLLYSQDSIPKIKEITEENTINFKNIFLKRSQKSQLKIIKLQFKI